MRKNFLCVLCFLLLLASCSRQNAHNGILIAVGIPPQQWFVSQIGGEKIQSMALAGPGQNHHNYEPSPRQIQNLSSAHAWILSGAEYEISLLPKVAAIFPNLLIVDGTEGVHFRTMEDHEHNNNHRDLAEHDHSSLEIDRHSWLGREPAKIMAVHIRDTLSFVDSGNEAFYHENCEALIKLIDKEFDSLKVELAPLKGNTVFVYHPSFGYFLDEFGIFQDAVEEGGKEPSPRQLNNLMAKLNEEKPTAIFVQAQFPVNAAKTLAAATGAELIELDPLAENWLENIKLMGQTLKMSALSRTGREML